MGIVLLGFTFLLTAMFPFGGYIAEMVTGGMYGPIFGKFPPILYHLIVLLISYAPMAIISYALIRTTNLAGRVPNPIPGKGFMLVGVILIVGYLAIRLFASTIQGGGPSFVVASYATYVIIPAKICLVIGSAKVLLSASANVS